MKKLLLLTTLFFASACLGMDAPDHRGLAPKLTTRSSVNLTSGASSVRTTTYTDLSSPASPKPEIDGLSDKQLIEFLMSEVDRYKGERDYHQEISTNYKKIAEKAQVQVTNAKTATQYQERAVAKAKINNAKKTADLQDKQIVALTKTVVDLKAQLKDKNAQIEIQRRQILQLEQNVRNLRTPSPLLADAASYTFDLADSDSGSDSDPTSDD